MDSEDEFGNNRIEDVSWLCSLSESELDMLISIKKLALQRAKTTGYHDLAYKFDLKLLRAIGLILMEHCKGQMKEVPELSGYAALLDRCKLLDCNLNQSMDTEEIRACISVESRKRKIEAESEDFETMLQADKREENESGNPSS